MNNQSDLDTTRHVRRILVKHWIDLGRLSVRCDRGRILVRGLLQRIPGTQQELTTPLVDAIFYELGRIKGVSRVTPYLDNWSNEGGRWRPAHKKKATAADRPDEPQRPVVTSEGSSGTHNIPEG